VSLQYVRDHYHVPAALLVRVIANQQLGVIAGATTDGKLRVQLLDQSAGPRTHHPTWRITYLAPPDAAVETLHDVAAGEVRHQTRRNGGDGRVLRRTRLCGTEMGRLTRAGLVWLPPLDPSGVTVYQITGEGEATLAAHKHLVASGPWQPPTRAAEAAR
jgi:hypothetical protein